MRLAARGELAEQPGRFLAAFQRLSGDQRICLRAREQTGNLFCHAAAFLLFFQKNVRCVLVIDADSEFFARFRSVLIGIVGGVKHIVKIEAPHMIRPVGRCMAVEPHEAL